MAKEAKKLTTEQDQLKREQAMLKAAQAQLEKDRELIAKLSTVSVHTTSRNRPAFPPTVNVCGNVLKVDPNTGKVRGDSDPKIIRRKVLAKARQKQLAGAGIMDVELPQGD